MKSTVVKLLPATAVVFACLSACNKAPEYEATGIFEATTVTISAETSGKILEFSVEEGDSVSLGQKIALVDTAMLTLRIHQVQSQRQSAENSSPDISAQTAALRAQIAHSESELRRQEQLLADGATTRQQYDNARSMVSTLQGQLRALLSTLDKNRTSISDNAGALGYQKDQIEEEIARCHISSPISGTLLVKYAEAGEYAIPGKPLAELADMNNVYLRAYFTASQLADIKLGQKVTVIADFGGDRQFEYPGTIKWIAEESEFTPKSIQTRDSRANLVYAVKIAVRNDGRIKLGQYGEVRL